MALVSTARVLTLGDLVTFVVEHQVFDGPAEGSQGVIHLLRLLRRHVGVVGVRATLDDRREFMGPRRRPPCGRMGSPPGATAQAMTRSASAGAFRQRPRKSRASSLPFAGMLGAGSPVGFIKVQAERGSKVFHLNRPVYPLAFLFDGRAAGMRKVVRVRVAGGQPVDIDTQDVSEERKLDRREDSLSIQRAREFVSRNTGPLRHFGVRRLGGDALCDTPNDVIVIRHNSTVAIERLPLIHDREPQRPGQRDYDRLSAPYRKEVGGHEEVHEKPLHQ